MASKMLLGQCRAANNTKSYKPRRLVLEPLEERRVLDAGPLLISEFMASNTHTLADVDGDFSDWIEIRNPTDAPISLNGWHLTDDAANLSKWQFPNVSLGARQDLVVFASGKDRRIAGVELHTNFKLDDGGEYLALVRPDATNVAHAYAPAYPSQLPDISYGVTRESTILLSQDATATAHVPTLGDAALGTSWTATAFDDRAWRGGSRQQPRILVTEVGTATPDYFEIQNVSDAAVATAGWFVAANDALSGSINAVVPMLLNLPATMTASQILYRTDSTAENYFGADIPWSTAGKGWLMIGDQQGDVVDFVVWGYTSAELASLQVTVNGFDITAADVGWDGETVPARGTISKTLQRQGNADHDSSADWDFISPHSRGTKNASLSLPFSREILRTGLGFSPDPGAFGGAVHSDVGAAMRNQNASLWTRIPFPVDDPSELNRLSLQVKYNDGFVAYLNGQEIARRNAPDVLSWNASATAQRTAAESSVDEEIDVTAFRGALLRGNNVLAIHGLNVSADNDNFLVLPTLVGIADGGPEHHFTSPTPGAPNPTGYVVINEIHYNSPNNAERIEFIELHNSAGTDADLSGWSLSDAVSYTLPAGTVIPAGGYLVIAESPATIQSKFGVNALGPWIGGLNHEGERVLLVNRAGQVEDEVAYKNRFPWPIAADGDGSSMELINAKLDNNLGASWRSSGYNTLILAGDPLDPLKAAPTPGRANSAWLANAPPQIRQVAHSPSQPATGKPVVVTAKVTDPDGVAQVQLRYQLVMPGSYIPAWLPLPYSTLLSTPARRRDRNPAFEDPASWITVTMVDNGTGPDAVAGDHVYSALIPAQATNRALVRYRIVATDTRAQAVTAPMLDDPSLNFAYYVFDGVPAYAATTRSVAPDGAGHVYSQEVMNSLPVYALITRAEDLRYCYAYTSDQIPIENDPARHRYNWEGAFFYDGQLYDHIDYRLRGANGRYHLAGKRNMRFRFNSGHLFQAKDDNGDPYPTQWRTLALGKNFDNRLVGNFGITETINSQLWNLVGVPAPYSYMIHFRVVDGAQEVPTGANSQYYGDFWGLFRAFEDYDRNFLEAHNLPLGNLYKLRDRVYNGKTVQDYQAPNAVSNAEDYDNVRLNVNSTKTVDWLLKNVNYDEWFLYHTVSEAIRHYDFPWGSEMVLKNLAWYFEPSAENPLGRVWYLPYDSDATWGPTWNDGLDQAKNAIYDIVDPTGTGTPKPELKLQYRNVMREFRDLVWQPEVINPWIDRLAAGIADFSFADRDRWKDAPADAGTQDFGTLAAKVQDMKNFAWLGGSWPGGGVGAGGTAATLDQLANAEGDATSIPNTPTISYVGLPGYPTNGLVFQTTPFSDPQGNNTFQAFQWRVAEVTDPTAPAYDPDEPVKFEWNAAWKSDTITTFNNRATVPSATVQTGHTYRARVRMQDNTGRWSHWSAPAQFTVTGPDNALALVDALRISEINYNPHAPSPEEFTAGFRDNNEFEFIELHNTGPNWLDLSTVQISEGISFSFASSPVKQLAPGQCVVVVENLSAFQARYGSGINVAGAFSGKLSNQGERIRLTATPTLVIQDFQYDDAGNWPSRASGKGSSIQMIDLIAVPSTEPQRTAYLQDGSHWRSSPEYGGSPGYVGGPVQDILINEVLSHTVAPQTDAIELYNTSSAAIDIGGWYLSDSSDNYRKFRIPAGTTIAPGAYVVFTEDDFNPAAPQPNPDSFGLDGAHGDDLWLLEATNAGRLTRFVDHVQFSAAKSGESLGRWPNGSGDLYPMLHPTLDPGAGENAGPRIGPLVISELQYRPSGDSPDAFEFLELYNPTAQAIDLTNWQLDGGIDFAFPAGTSLASHSVLVVVPFAPSDAAKLAAFRSYYGIGPSVHLVGPYLNRLSDQGERVRLERPDTSPLDEPGFIPHVLEDEVDYAASWYPGANGAGDSLHRQAANRWGNDLSSWAASTPSPGSVSFLPGAFVAGRHVFYNQSAFDGFDAGADPRDDAAIAPDKTALLPGQTASFANYTSYCRGINGIMVDLAGLPSDATLTAADFAFRMGNSDDPATWNAAPSPSLITVRPAAGVDGSSRVTMLWPDGAIQNHWLAVNVLATAQTGLASPDVFYFGNAVGESGNSNAETQVNAIDLLLTRNNQRGFLNPASVDSPFDYNRDARVNALDMLLTRNHWTGSENALELIKVPTTTARTATAQPKLQWLSEFDSTTRKARSSPERTPRHDAIDILLARRD